jgi:hypothetical protein
MRLNGKFFIGVALLAAVAAGSFLSQYVGKAHAQLDAVQTWVTSANVGGTSNAVILTIPNVTSSNDLLGVPLRFLPASSNSAGATTVTIYNGFLNVLTTQAIYRVSGGALVPIAGGDFGSGVRAEIVWDGTQFTQTNPATGTDPVGMEKLFSGAAAVLPSGYLVENGICVSQTTYPALYASYGSADLYSPGSTGGACPGGQFHVKFANGRASVAADTQGGVTANILTNSGSGCAATGPGILCGAQNRTLAQNSLPNVTLGGSATITGHNSGGAVGVGQGGAFGGQPWNAGPGANAVSGNQALSTEPTWSQDSGSITTNSINGGVTQIAVPTVQPTSTGIMLVKY